jgi:hypothetical protein
MIQCQMRSHRDRASCILQIMIASVISRMKSPMSPHTSVPDDYVMRRFLAGTKYYCICQPPPHQISKVPGRRSYLSKLLSPG